MALTSDQITLMFRRLKASPDGEQWAEYFQQLAKDNYDKFKNSDSSFNDICKGFAFCVDSLSECLEKCDKVVLEQDVTPKKPEGDASLAHS